MGLHKEIELPSGVVVSYHRIAGLYIITNQQNNINLLSYTSKEKRNEELTAIEQARNDPDHTYPDTNIFMQDNFIVAPYDQNMTIASAYEYLKEHEGYEDADDVFEEGQPEGEQEEA